MGTTSSNRPLRGDHKFAGWIGDDVSMDDVGILLVLILLVVLA